jgi:hypothetical protein
MGEERMAGSEMETLKCEVHYILQFTAKNIFM